MPRPSRIEFPGALNYISIHSHAGAKVFQDDIDRNRFLQILDFGIRRYELKLYSYVLLEDGYRLMFETPMGNLTKSIQYLNSHYMAYLNTRRGKTGRIFSGRYKSVVVEPGEYALKVCRYMHLLPVRAGLASHPENYHWTSHYRYATGKDTPPELHMEPLLSRFEGPADRRGLEFHKYVLSGLSEDRDNIEKLLKKKRVIGSPEFQEGATEEAPRPAPAKILPDTVIAETAKYHQVSEDMIKNNKTKPNFPRNVAIYLCRNMTGVPLDELGDLFGVGPSSICNTAKRVEAHKTSDAAMDKSIREIGAILADLRQQPRD